MCWGGTQEHEERFRLLRGGPSGMRTQAQGWKQEASWWFSSDFSLGVADRATAGAAGGGHPADHPWEEPGPPLQRRPRRRQDRQRAVRAAARQIRRL